MALIIQLPISLFLPSNFTLKPLSITASAKPLCKGSLLLTPQYFTFFKAKTLDYLLYCQLKKKTIFAVTKTAYKSRKTNITVQIHIR
jgi:hypothetical protein